MKFAGLRIANFLTIGDATVNLDDRGLVLVQGVNEDDTSADSNGAGKSSIMDALCWAIYGTTARGEEGDKVVNRFRGKECSVAVDVIDGAPGDEVLYTVTRYRKHKTGKNSLTVTQVLGDGSETPLTKGTDKLTQEVVDRIVGSSYDVFRASIYAGQENFPDLPGMTDKNLKVLVEEAAGVTVLEKAYDEARTRLNAATTAADAARTRQANAVNARAMLGDQRDEAISRKSAFETTRAGDLATLTTEVRDFVARAKTLKADLDAADEPGVLARIQACDDALAAVAGENVEHRRLTSEMSKAEIALDRAKSAALSIKARFEREVKARDELKHQVGCPCGECGKPIEAGDVEAAVKIAHDKAVKTREEFNAAKASRESAQEALKLASDALSVFAAAMTDVSETSAQRRTYEAQRAAIETLKVQMQRAAQAARDAKARLDKVKAAENPYGAEIEKLEERMLRSDELIAGLEAEVEKLRNERAIAETVVKVFSPAGVRAHILDTVTPFLNDRTAVYLGTLSDGNIQATWTTLVRTAKGELREKFSIEVANELGGERFAAISGGEKRKVRIAAALALQDLVASRATKPIELFIGDEIDDGLDNAGRERLMLVLDERAKERGSVFVISHSDLKMWIPQVITVTKKDRVSTITEELV